MKVLLVDDSRAIRNIQKNVLAQMGSMEIIEAADGVEALARVTDDQPDLILLDRNMPNMDGLEFLAKLRGAGNKTPVIMCTTEAEKSRVIEAIKAGATNYIVKPFTPESLAAKINETIAKVGIGR
jgi:two-component system chemotaxis response regulator CheY